MTTSEVIQTIIYLGGLSGVVYWAGKWFHALKGAIEAQKTTIDAQRAIIEGMANFMNVADAPKMAERYEAYKKIVDLEKDAIRKQTEVRLLEEKNLLLQSTAQLNAAINDQLNKLDTRANLKDEFKELDARFQQVTSRLIEAVIQLAVHYQLNPLEWEAQKPTTSAQLVKNIETIMHMLPPPPPRPKTPAEIFWEEGKKHLLTGGVLESKKDKPE